MQRSGKRATVQTEAPGVSGHIGRLVDHEVGREISRKFSGSFPSEIFRGRPKQCFCFVFVLFFVLFLLVLVVLVVVLVLLGVVLV